jgi:hypothetical protein
LGHLRRFQAKGQLESTCTAPPVKAEGEREYESRARRDTERDRLPAIEFEPPEEPNLLKLLLEPFLQLRSELLESFLRMPLPLLLSLGPAGGMIAT